MPEGDTVWLAAKRMNQALAGERLTRGELRVPQLAALDLSGRTVDEVVCQRTAGLPSRRSVDLRADGQFVSLSADN